VYEPIHSLKEDFDRHDKKRRAIDESGENHHLNESIALPPAWGSFSQADRSVAQGEGKDI